MDFRFRSLLLILVVLSLIHYTAGITFYLSSSIGDDKANGTSPTSPWQSLTRASLAVSNGQAPNATLLLLSGDTFLLETAAFFHNVTNGFTISSYSLSASERRPVLLRPSTSAAGPTLTIDESTDVTIRGLEIRGGEVGIAFTFCAGGQGLSEYEGNLEVSDCYFEGIRGLDYNASSGNWWGASVALAAGRWPVLVRNVRVIDNLVNGSDTFFKNEVPWPQWTRVELSGLNISRNALTHNGYNILFLDSVSHVTVESNVFLDNTPLQLFVAGTTDIIFGTLNSSVLVIGNEMSRRGEFQPGGPDGCAVDFETNATGLQFVDNYVSRAFGAGVMVFGHEDGSNTELVMTGNRFLFNGCNQTRGDHGGIAFMHKGSSGSLTGNIMITCPGVPLLYDQLDPGLPDWILNNTVDGEGGVTLSVTSPPIVVGTPQQGGGLIISATHPQPNSVILRYSNGSRPNPTSPVFPSEGIVLQPDWRALAVFVKAFPISTSDNRGLVYVESESAGGIFSP
jgi:hypothetical protein